MKSSRVKRLKTSWRQPTRTIAKTARRKPSRFGYAESTEAQAEEKAAGEAPTPQQQGSCEGLCEQTSHQKGRSARSRIGRGERARRGARRNQSGDPKDPEEPQVELEGECRETRSTTRGPDRLGPISEAGYVNRYADWCVGRLVWCRNREAIGKIFRKEYIWELV